MENRHFRGQPSFQTFNKSLDKHDGIYRQLNELDRECIYNKKESDKMELKQIVLDPRTQEHVNYEICDESKERNWPCFDCDYGSKLNRYHHAACLRVLLANSRRELQSENNLLVSHVDKEVFQSTMGIRKAEYIEVQKYIQGEEKLDKEIMFRPMKYLVMVYQNWYAQKTARLLQVIDDLHYVTVLGLPKVGLCHIVDNGIAEIIQLEIIERQGEVRLLKKYEDNFNYRSLKAQMETCISLLNDTKSKWPMKTPNDLEANTFLLPLESLLFLLSAGDYVDLPTEMLFMVQDHPIPDYLSVHFELPLPSRDCGWHTNCQLAESAFAARISMPGQAEWFNITLNGITPVEEDFVAPEIDGRRSGERNYKVQSFDNYIKKKNIYTSTMQSRRSDFIKTNQTVLRWHLKPSDPNLASFIIYNSLSIPAVLDEKGDSLLGCHQIKLENKFSYGCEIMTKYELLRAWLQLTLLEAQIGLCTRVDLDRFDVCLNQYFTVDELEQKLKEHYNVDMPQLLGKLHKFLKILIDLKPGKYLLRYNCKNSDKLLLCSPTKELSSHALHLHSLIKSKASDYEFMSQDVYLPIADYLCSAMHLQHQIMPCAFWPKRLKRKPRPTREEILRKERERILRKVQNRQIQKQNEFKKKSTKRKRNLKKSAKQCKNLSKNEMDKIYTL